MKKTIHLLANSHLDPVWLWEWPEGVAEALALARVAARFCEDLSGFVFNRGEVIFYEWLAEFDPKLFARIKRLIKRGRWHVMGGWYLQPDCNLPRGEALVRQILVGRRYFQEKFGVRPTTAINLDPFGHSRGLVQILAQSGYDSYLFCRPEQKDCGVPDTEFTWVGYAGSTVTAALAAPHYISPPGGARAKVEEWLERYREKECALIPWGVGNHGGGPSQEDLLALEELRQTCPDREIYHSTPERFFADLLARGISLPRHAGDLNPWAVGCYTSMMRVKQGYRRLESELFLTEKMVTTAAAQGLVDYPRADLAAAQEDLLFCQFHDCLPGTGTPPVEDHILRRLGHGREILERLRTRAFFALTAGQPVSAAREFPILVYNPHPYPVTTLVECELQGAWPNETEQFLQPRLEHRGRAVPVQAEQPHSNINEDHRKRIVFSANLAPGRMHRFSCYLDLVDRLPRAEVKARAGTIRCKSGELEVVINTRTGLVDRYRVAGVDYLSPGACKPLVMRDNADPWGMGGGSFRRRAGAFKLASRAGAARISGLPDNGLAPVRIIADGPVRTVVEAIFVFADSHICQRYLVPKQGGEMGLQVRVHWGERDRMLKLALPTPLRGAKLRGQVAYGVADLPENGDEALAQQWVALVDSGGDRALSCSNDSTYGCDYRAGELRLSLLRAPASAAHPKGVNRALVPQDRHTPRLDQGEHLFHLWIQGGRVRDRMVAIDREALGHNERPLTLCCYPSGEGKLPAPGVELSGQGVQVGACKYAEGGKDLVLRLFNPTTRMRRTRVKVPFLAQEGRVSLRPGEVKTLQISGRGGKWLRTNLLEEEEC